MPDVKLRPVVALSGRRTQTSSDRRASPELWLVPGAGIDDLRQGRSGVPDFCVAQEQGREAEAGDVRGAEVPDDASGHHRLDDRIALRVGKGDVQAPPGCLAWADEPEVAIAGARQP